MEKKRFVWRDKVNKCYAEKISMGLSNDKIEKSYVEKVGVNKTFFFKAQRLIRQCLQSRYKVFHMLLN